ncbi:MAG TPA: hypothetical protein VFN67_23520 [Polyangiales bacterium]|nr:hypothetical protein [Polyangiales bacterium]
MKSRSTQTAGGRGELAVESSGVVSVDQLKQVSAFATRPGALIANETQLSSDRSLWLQPAVSVRLRLIAASLALLVCVVTWRVLAGSVSAPTLEQSLATQLERRGLSVEPGAVIWLDPKPSWLGVRSALFTAKRDNELHDIYYADVRVSQRSVIDVYSLTNTTRSSSADEALIKGGRGFAVYASRVGDAYRALVLVNTRGESSELTRSWPWYAKVQNAISNLQDTGRMRAFGLRRYHFQNPVTTLDLRVRSGLVRAVADGEMVLIDPRKAEPIAGADQVEVELPQKGQPGLITWVVDTVRRVPYVGKAPVEWLEHTVFGLTDRASRAYHEFVETDTAAEAQRALAVAKWPHASKHEAAQAQVELAAVEEPAAPEDIGWPPAKLAPVLKDEVRGEGIWLPVTDDAFAASEPNGTPLFFQSFIRVDPERTYTRVYVTLWDPRMVQLGIAMGTKEPESATGETGNGLIPRDPYVLSHLVGAFNGGFQAMHGEFGMMANKRVYLPPKPYAATIAVFEDGSMGMGSWPGPGRHAWDETFANSQIPEGMLAMRQNLTSVVEGETWNPWERWWWGAAPEWAKEQTYIHRSGLCLTKEGFFAYFWGESMGPEELGKAMLATRCVRGMHLDMNSKHTGFEFYRPYTRDEELPEIGRALRPTEFQTSLTNDPLGMRFRGRLAVTTMSPIRLPRYLAQDPRDYFYLLRKPILPGANLPQANGNALRFSTQGLPTAGFPHAFARARTDTGLIARIDLSRAVPKPLADPSLARALGHVTFAKPEGPVPSQAGTALFAAYANGHVRAQIGRPSAGSHVLFTGPLVSEAPQALAALGVDNEGFLVYAQAARAGEITGLLQRAGISQAIALADGRLVLQTEEGPRGIDGLSAPVVDETTSLTLMAETRPAAQVLFQDVQPMPYRKWGWLQGQRVRYFPSHPARFQAPETAQ